MVEAADDESMETAQGDTAALKKQTHSTPLADEGLFAFQRRLYSAK